MKYVEQLLQMVEDYSHICVIVLLFILNLRQNECVSEEKTVEWNGSRVFLPVFKKNKRAFIKYVDNNHLVEIKLLEVLRTMESI